MVLGPASSSYSFAAHSAARPADQGRGVGTGLAFLFASTNLSVEVAALA